MMGRKADDMFTVPLCNRCHSAWHTRDLLPIYAGLATTEEKFRLARAKSVALMYQREAQLMAAWVRQGDEDVF